LTDADLGHAAVLAGAVHVDEGHALGHTEQIDMIAVRGDQ
jgi:hypothetical protein